MVEDISYKELLPNPNELPLHNIIQAPEGWMVEAEGQNRATCPSCGVASHSRHSRYWRQLKDLPLQGTP